MSLLMTVQVVLVGRVPVFVRNRVMNMLGSMCVGPVRCVGWRAVVVMLVHVPMAMGVNDRHVGVVVAMSLGEVDGQADRHENDCGEEESADGLA